MLAHSLRKLFESKIETLKQLPHLLYQNFNLLALKQKRINEFKMLLFQRDY